MPPQIVRLVLLTVGIVVTYMIAKTVLTPKSFGEYGWYRGVALDEIRSYEPVFAGRKACEECHSDIEETLVKGSHKTLSCEGCHGPGGTHARNPDIKIDKRGYSPCVRCHEENPSRPKWHKQINIKDHYTGDKCTDCHIPHDPSEAP